MTPAELKAAWLEALRSGKYPFGQLNYYDGKCYCAIGVLAVVDSGYMDVTFREVDKALAKLRLMELENNHFRPITKLNDKSENFEPVIKYIEENVHV